MQLSQLVGRVIRALPAVPPGKIGYNDIVDMLNEAQQYLAMFSHKTAVWSGEQKADNEAVIIPEDSLKLVSVYWGNDRRELETALNRLPAVEDNSATTLGEPMRYYTMDQYIILEPAPRTTEDVTITYIPRPASMVKETDTPDLVGSDEFLIANTLHKIHMENNSPAMQLWEVKLAQSLAFFMETTEQDYVMPFQVKLQW